MAKCPKCGSGIPCFRSFISYYFEKQRGLRGMLRVYKCRSCEMLLQLDVGRQILFIAIFIIAGLAALILTVLYSPKIDMYRIFLPIPIIFVPLYYLWWRFLAKFICISQEVGKDTSGYKLSANFKVVDVLYLLPGKCGVKGQLDGGPIHKGDIVSIVSKSGATKSYEIQSIAREGKKDVPSASSGETIFLWLPYIQREDIENGSVLRIQTK
ncbi:hypothetical protein ACFL96_08245 [Thermoproteota archaeon]